MSNKKTSQTLTEKVLAFLKLGDDAKIRSFFDKQVKVIQRSIKNIESEKLTLERQYSIDQEHLQEQLEDAAEAVNAAYLNITVDNVSSNEKQAEFANVYWSGVEKAENKVKSIQSRIKSLEETYTSDIKRLDSEIATYNSKLSNLLGE